MVKKLTLWGVALIGKDVYICKTVKIILKCMELIALIGHFIFSSGMLLITKSLIVVL